MAVQNGTTTNVDDLGRSASVPSYDANYTALLWFRVVTDPSAWCFGTLFELGKEQFDSYYFDDVGVYNGATMSLRARAVLNGSGQEATGSTNLTTGAWYCMGLIRAADDDRRVYLGTLTTLLALEASITTGIGSRSANPAGWMSCRRYRDSGGVIAVGNMKVWTRALSLAELQAEQFRMLPNSFDSLTAWLPFLDTGTARGTDYARVANFSTYGTMTDTDNPPVSWGAPSQLIQLVEAESDTDELTAAGITTAAPVLGTPTLGQTHDLTATGIAAAAPSLGASTLGQTHALASTAIITAAPVLGATTIGQAHELVATAITTAAPTIANATIGQAHVLTATSIATSAPAVDTPTIEQVHVLTATSIVAAAPVLGAPSMSGIVDLLANGILTGSPVLDAPVLGQIVPVPVTTPPVTSGGRSKPGRPYVPYDETLILLMFAVLRSETF